MKWIKRLLLWYFIFVIVKSVLSYFIPAPSTFSDSYIYAKMARSFFYSLSLDVHGLPSNHYPPLYPITLSISYLFRDMQSIYIVMKIINSILSSLIIFPSWLIAKEFISKKKALSISVLISLLPSNFSFSGYIMAENLFYPLFLFSIYFIYKAFTSEKYSYSLIAGVLIGLTFLTRNLGLILFGIVAFMVIQRRKTSIIILMTGLITILPWLIRNLILFGINFNNLLGTYASPLNNLSIYQSLLSFLTWIVLYTGFLILASGGLFFMNSINFIRGGFKNTKSRIYIIILLLSTTFFLVILAKHNIGLILYDSLFSWLSGRPVGRYIDTIIPLILIAGFVGMYISTTISKLNLIITSLILTFSSQLIFFPLFPVNNMSLIWLGILSYFYKSIFLAMIFLFLLPFILYLIYKKINKKNIVICFIVFFFFIKLNKLLY